MPSVFREGVKLLNTAVLTVSFETTHTLFLYTYKIMHTVKKIQISLHAKGPE